MIARLFRTPSAYLRDPWGFARNQVGHGFVSALVGCLALEHSVAMFAGAMIIGLFLYTWWEWAQYRTQGALAWDCVEDWAFVATGFCVAFTPLLLLPMAGHLLAGAMRREARRQTEKDRQWRLASRIDRARWLSG